MSIFILMVYIGGAFVEYPRPIGFWKRVFWPEHLGKEIFRWVLERESSTK